LTEENVTGQRGWRALVSRRDTASLDVVLPEAPLPERDRPTFRIDLASDEIARQRQLTALRQAGSAERGRLAQLRDVLLGQRAPRFGERRPIEPLDTGLNRSQVEAVEFALTVQDRAIIH